MLTLISGFLSENFILIVMIIGSILVLKRDRELGFDSTRFIYYVIVTTMVLCVVEYAESQLSLLETVTAQQILARKILSWVGYTLRPIAVMFFVRIVSHLQKRTMAWLYSLAFINSLIYATTFVPNEAIQAFAFNYDAENSFIRGPLGYSVHIATAIYIIVALVVLSKTLKGKSQAESGALAFCCIAGVFASLIETLGADITGHYVNPTLIVAGLIYYIFLHTQSTQTHSHEKDVLLADQRTAMMVSEIEPRFIYEILDHIKDKAVENPEVTEKTLKSLVGYLGNSRDKMDFIHPIPFIEELERTKNYIGIEQARHPGLGVKLQIEDTDFKVPALTVQHIVDNAINHGFDENSRGIITIKSFASSAGHIIIIQDNGKGFDPQKQKDKVKQGARFGTRNVEERLNRMVNGTLSIVTKPDGGTTVMISIPSQIDEESIKKPQEKQTFKTVDGVTMNPNMPSPKQ